MSLNVYLLFIEFWEILILSLMIPRIIEAHFHPFEPYIMLVVKMGRLSLQPLVSKCVTHFHI